MTPSARLTLLEGVLLSLESGNGAASRAVSTARQLLEGASRPVIDLHSPRVTTLEIAETRAEVLEEIAKLKDGKQVDDEEDDPERDKRTFKKYPGLKLVVPGGVEEAKLSTNERDKLPATAFVFPKTREYPVHDEEHARKALQLSGGKPEHAKVVAAVKKKFPKIEIEEGRFDPLKHPHDRVGHFRRSLDGLKPGESAAIKGAAGRVRRLADGNLEVSHPGKGSLSTKHSGQAALAAFKDAGLTPTYEEKLKHRPVKLQEAEVSADHPSCNLPHAKMARRGKRICPNCKKPLKLEEAKDSMAKASTPEPVGHGGKNWFTEMGDMLPPYIQHIANDLIEKRGKTESNAVQMAIGIVKRWAKGAGNVTATTRAAAAKAVAQWEKLKAKRKALSTAKKAGKKLSEAELLEAAVLDRILALEEGAVELAEAFFEELVEAKITEPVKEPEATPKDAKGGDSAPKDTETVSPAGERVAQLQRRLSSLGFETKVDGTFGPHTSETVKTFQRHAGLNVDGIVGAKTTEALKRAPHPAEMEDADKDSFLGGEAETPSDQAPEDLPKGQDGDVAPEAPSGETISAPRTERGKTTPAPKSSAKPPSGKLGEGESVHLYKGMGVGEKKADERVRETQAKLGHLGYEVHTDGRFGPQTEKTVKRFQRKFGLKPDGIVGPKTHRAMSGVVKKKKRLTECVDQRKQATGSTAVRLLAQERMLRTQLTEGYDAVGLDLEEFWSPQARLAAVEKRREISRMSPPHEIGTRVHVAAPTGPLGSDHGGYEGTVINHVRDPWGAHMYDVKIDKVRPGNKPRDRIAARVTHPVGQVMRAEQGDVTKLQEAWSPAARAAALMSRRSHHGFGDLHPDWMERRHDEFPGEGAAKEGDRAHGMTEIGQRAFGTVRGEHLVTDSGTRIRTVGAPQKVTNAAGYEQRPRGAAPKADHGFSVPADVKVKATKGGFDFKAPEHDEPYKVREHPKGFTVRTPQEGRMIGEFPGVESNNPTVFPTHSAAAEAVGQHIAHARRARAYWNDYAAKNPAFRTSGRASTKPSQEGI